MTRRRYSNRTYIQTYLSSHVCGIYFATHTHNHTHTYTHNRSPRQTWALRQHTPTRFKWKRKSYKPRFHVVLFPFPIRIHRVKSIVCTHCSFNWLEGTVCGVWLFIWFFYLSSNANDNWAATRLGVCARLIGDVMLGHRHPLVSSLKRRDACDKVFKTNIPFYLDKKRR